MKEFIKKLLVFPTWWVILAMVFFLLIGTNVLKPIEINGSLSHGWAFVPLVAAFVYFVFWLQKPGKK